MNINWAAISIASTIALGSVSGVWTLTSAAQSITADMTSIKVEQKNQGEDLSTVKRRVDFIYEQFFSTGQK